MDRSRAEWERYERWNGAVADVVYTPATAGKPAYLDLEEDVLDSIRDLAEPEAAEAAAALIEATRSVLRVDAGPSAFLRTVLQRLARWERERSLEPPPTLALLAVLSFAAENMQEGDGKAAHNFYGRVAEVLDLDEKQLKCFIDAYRCRRDGAPTSERLWGSLSSWLERLEGNRGLPTAFADTHAHVGLPLSQALVRKTDRDKLSDLFASYGLHAHSSLPTDEVEELIDEWLSRVPCPASNSFERMWKRDRFARARIIETAQTTLGAWDGTTSRPVEVVLGGRQTGSVRVMARLHRFLGARLEINLVVPAFGEPSDTALTLLDAEGEAIGELDLTPLASGWLGLADPSDIDAASFLRGEARLRGPGSPVTLHRRPRRLIPLRHDDLLQGFIECERINLGEAALLLVREEIADRVEGALHLAARPGFVRHDNLVGTPEGWSLFEDVQILSTIPPELMKQQLVDVNVLQPTATSQVTLEGGLRLPGNIRKWSAARPPELRVIATSAAQLEARITCTRPLTYPAPAPLGRTSDQPVLIWDLAETELPDGDYEIAITEAGEPVGRPEVVRLRSADNAAVVVDDGGQPIAHDPSAPLFGLTPTRPSPQQGFRVAPIAAAPEAGRAQETSVPRWFTARQLRRSSRTAPPPAQFPGPGAGSCMLTGAHHIDVETAWRHMTSVEGVCRTCGLVKRYPTRGRRKRAAGTSARHVGAPRIQVVALPPVHRDEEVGWAIGFDALCHIGKGPISALDRVATQIEGTGLFGDAFVRRLEVLGHIEVERDRRLAPSAWEVVDPVLAGLPDGKVVLLGFRSEGVLVAAEDAAWAAGVEVTTDERIDAPARIRVESDDPEVIARVAEAISRASGRHVQHIPDAGRALAANLPPLSRAISALPTTSAVSGRSVERWDPITARFDPAPHSGAPGAYRIKSFGRSYLFRCASDLTTMTARVGDARIVKHAAALATGLPLVGYDSGAKVLYTPLGADLPGFYGRAAVLASGRPPTEDREQRLLEYRNVPPDLAGRLCDLLMS